MLWHCLGSRVSLRQIEPGRVAMCRGNANEMTFDWLESVPSLAFKPVADSV